MSQDAGAAGIAALSICESLLLSLTENGIIKASEAKVILEDAATAHRNAIAEATDPAPHAAAALIIELIIENGNSVRRR